VLYLAFELGWTSRKLAFTIGAGQKPRLCPMPARSLDTLMLEIHHARRRFGLPAETPVTSCYEAGRDGFWLHRYLAHQGIENLVVDAASIEVNRRRRRAKSDNLDAAKLVGMLIRWHLGDGPPPRRPYLSYSATQDGRLARFGRIDRGVVGPTREVPRQQSHAMHVATRSSPVRNRLQTIGECKTCMGGLGAPGPANSDECH
jgi:hypothetical protein